MHLTIGPEKFEFKDALMLSQGLVATFTISLALIVAVHR